MEAPSSQHTWAEFWRELHADIKGNPILSIGAVLAAGAAGYGIWEVGISLPDIGNYGALLLAGTFEVAMIGLAWESRRKLVAGQRLKSVLWAVVGFCLAVASSWFATSVGIIEHGEGTAGWIRMAFPLVAFAGIHVLFLSSVEERQAARAREEKDRQRATVSRMANLAKQTWLATGEARTAKLAEFQEAQTAVEALGAGVDIIAITEEWARDDAQLAEMMQKVAERAAAWLEEKGPTVGEQPQGDLQPPDFEFKGHRDDVPAAAVQDPTPEAAPATPTERQAEETTSSTTELVRVPAAARPVQRVAARVEVSRETAETEGSATMDTGAQRVAKLATAVKILSEKPEIQGDEMAERLTEAGFKSAPRTGRRYRDLARKAIDEQSQPETVSTAEGGRLKAVG